MISGIGNASQLSSKLFSALDTKSQGFLEKSDFTSAFSKLSSSSGTSSTSDSSSVDDLFSALDSNSNGQVTESEFASTLAKLQEQLDGQFNQMRMHGGGGHGGPQGAGGPPPPPPANDAGLTKDELSTKLEEIGSNNSKLSSSLSNIVNNFEAADTNSDGKVSFTEAMAYDQSSKSSASSGDSATPSGTSTNNNGEAKVMMKIMQLMQAYTQQDQSSNAVSSLLSVSA
jgi:Ca2+-binding EF-hand superfamily protein